MWRVETTILSKHSYRTVWGHPQYTAPRLITRPLGDGIHQGNPGTADFLWSLCLESSIPVAGTNGSASSRLTKTVQLHCPTTQLAHIQPSENLLTPLVWQVWLARGRQVKAMKVSCVTRYAS